MTLESASACKKPCIRDKNPSNDGYSFSIENARFARVTPSFQKSHPRNRKSTRTFLGRACFLAAAASPLSAQQYEIVDLGTPASARSCRPPTVREFERGDIASASNRSRSLSPEPPITRAS
jgi:hypothetical protein